MPTEPYRKPLPAPTAETAPYWAATKQHRLVFQQCADCGRKRHYPQVMCPACGSFAATWEPYEGGGTIFTWTVVHQVQTPGFADETPYNIVVVQLENGLRLTGNLRNGTRADLRRGRRVRVIYEEITSEITLPQFEPEPE